MFSLRLNHLSRRYKVLIFCSNMSKDLLMSDIPYGVRTRVVSWIQQPTVKESPSLMPR